MQLKEFADTLRNIENDRMIMSYGNNAAVVGSILSVVDLVQSLSRAMRQDRQNDVFSMNISNQIMQLESSVIMFGMQRLSQNGINLPPQLAPYGQQPIYNQPAYNPNLMYSGAPNYSSAPQFQQYQPQYQQPQQQQSQYQQQQPQYQAPPQYQQPQAQQQPQYQAPPQQAPTPAPAPAPAPAAAPKPQKPIMNSGDDDDAPQAKPTGSGKGASMNLPGLGGGDEKAAGRDYLLNLLGDK